MPRRAAKVVEKIEIANKDPLKREIEREIEMLEPQNLNENRNIVSLAKMARDSRHRAIYEEYNALMSVPGQRSMDVLHFLMKKYKVKGSATIYAIRKKIAKELGTSI